MPASIWSVFSRCHIWRFLGMECHRAPRDGGHGRVLPGHPLQIFL
uniref:Uncharacterized protein n=1 Tax=Anguilla anguilla TaxID=7936 RepID=A0A0E9W9G7_ANGAN